MPDLVSVVLPTHDSERYVGEAVSSILAQSHENLEVLVTDDASSDDTVRIVRDTAREDRRVKLAQHSTNLGAAATRNASISRAHGRYLAFCDADDRWLPEKLQRQLKFMARHHAAFSFTAFQLIDADGRETGRYVDLGNRHEVGYEDMLRKRATLGCSTVVIDREQIPKVQMPDLRTGQDYATWLGILREGHQALCLDEALTHYRMTPGSLSRNKVQKARRQWQIYRSVEGLGAVKSGVCFCSYVFHAVFRP